jgi:Cys-rich protein (TIGR01571 family)|uniref:Uncharacterized protein n=1 Tax=Globisporangium ultimum (strain ATCC 200006 / CBS 805.95 / DAOM BR144) TaxID=431595 RepID=K3X1I9_GLOUD
MALNPNKSCPTSNNNDPMQATLTPHTSTFDAPFLIQVDEDSNSSNSNDTLYVQKLRSKTLQSVPENRSMRVESNESTHSKMPPGEWRATLIGCLDWRKPSNFAVLACCPCLPAAKVHSMLGKSFESGVLYFAGLVFGILISIGLCFSNTSSVSEDGAVVTNGSDSGHSSVGLFGNLAVVLAVLFLVGVAYLRTRTRQHFNIPGNQVFDCVLSFACCWCVISQAKTHHERHIVHEFGLDTPTDTLPAYT